MLICYCVNTPNQTTMIIPFLTDGFSHYYRLAKSTFIVRGIRSDFKDLSNLSMKFLLANRIAPDETFLRCHVWGYIVCLCPTNRTSSVLEQDTLTPYRTG